MIIAKIADALQYKGICSNLDKALERFGKDLPTLEPGHVDIDGDNLFLNCFDYNTFPDNETQYEYHKLYGDIQIVLKGEEKILVNMPENLDTYEQAGDDCWLARGEAAYEVVLHPGDFLVVFPKDAHRIKMQVNGACPVRKAVYKFKL